MRFWPRTLGGQLLALLLGALALSQVISFLIYSSERAEALRAADRSGLIESVASLMRVLQQAPPELRAALARAASSGRMRVWTTDNSEIDPSQADRQVLPTQFARLFSDTLREPPRWAILRGAAMTVAPQPAPANGAFPVRPLAGPAATPAVALPFVEDRYDVVVSVPFRDSGWLNAQTQIRAESTSWAWPSLVSTAVMAVAILLIIWVTTRRATLPLKSLAVRADALGRGTPEPPMPPDGPDEIARVTTAFNRMQERLERFVTDRTRMIAAIGHDLRTPITSLRLRAELLDDDEARAKIMATLDDMQGMVEATLAFAREEARVEEARTVDLSALVASVVDDLSDLGHEVTFADPGRTARRCRPNALRRALTNLILNAVQYGSRARVTLTTHGREAVIAIEDDGPGIPDDKLEEVFQPFVRLETSRSRATGGVGLGLSIARSIVLAHGGHLVLSNRGEGGLRAEIRLPRDEGAHA